ncbi:MAG: molybdenum cofactor biosynthesis protein MoaAD [Gammaproteobacteria bacterium]|nr:molybdenum cofactor biosynthesis protein MoaAD [Gammaproteobacteria bacterium]
MNAAIYGLVLAGGHSTRMKRDKATLAYHGRTQLAQSFALLQAVTERTFISVRTDQIDEATRRNFPQIVDHLAGVDDDTALAGPLAGILAAQHAHTNVAWWILACDLPFLDIAALNYLLAARNSTKLATAFTSAHDGLPEPLCTIFEARSAPALLSYATSGHYCPRKFLIKANEQGKITLISPYSARSLENINSSEEYLQAMNALNTQESHSTRCIKVQYFALLREQAGCSEETLLTDAQTPAALYLELAIRHPFTLPQEMLRVAVNATFGAWTQPLATNDTVVFIPPVAGG